jgi:hypothetical protein
MPYELYLNDNEEKYIFKKQSEIPKEYYKKIIAFYGVGMKISSITNIGLKFPNIEHLEVGYNNIKILDLSYFPNLKTLLCNRNKIIEIIGFEFCNKLEEVHLSCNLITKINSNHNIKLLEIDGNLLEELPDFNNLETLSAKYNVNLNKLGNYPKLTLLDISKTLISNLYLYMNLKHLFCTLTIIKTLPPFPKLEELECDKSLLKNLPYLPLLDIIKN